MGIDLEILSLDKIYKNNIVKVLLPGGEGELEVLSGHTRLITYIKPGTLKVIGEGFKECFNVGFGLAEINPRKITLITENFGKKNKEA